MRMMATLTEVALVCDMCGSSEDVQTQIIGLDGKTSEVDLCQKDRDDLNGIADGYIGKARKSTTRRSSRRQAKKREAKKPQAKKPAPKRAAKAAGPEQEKGIVVYGILPEDIEVADVTPGIGEHAGPLRIVHSDGLAALISEVEPSGRLGTPDDRRAYREILDGTASEVPVLPLRFGTVLASEDAVTDELLATQHDEFAGALEKLDGRAEFVVRGRYADQEAGPERAEATRALEEAMADHCVASVVRKPARGRDGIEVAFLVDADREGDVERVIEDLAREWDGRIELELVGPTAAYDFMKPGKLPG
jgi:hypothetical protein